MTLVISKELLDQIHAHGEEAYPEEGAGFLIGDDSNVRNILPLQNAREDEARHNRFLITPEDYLKAELTADKLGLSLIGVFIRIQTIQIVPLNMTASGHSHSFPTSLQQ